LKKLLALVALVLMLLEPAFSATFGNSYSGSNDRLKLNHRSEADFQKNILKIDPLKLVFGGVNLSYERLLTPSSSINIRAKYHSLGFIERWIGDFSTSGDNYAFRLTDHPHFQAIGVDAEYRFYIKNKKPAQGLYIAPYARYQNYTGKFESLYATSIANQPIFINSDLKTSFTIWGAGVQLGAQWLIKDKVSIDWGFAGLGIDRYSFKVSVSSDNLYDTVDEYTRDLRYVLGGVSNFLAKKVAFNALDNELSSKVPFWMIGWKSFLTVGIAF
jgi:hypothetical protein